jgi:predicted ATPase
MAASRAPVTIDGDGGTFGLYRHQHARLRRLHVSELSDSTLRCLVLVTALMTPLPPPLVVLKEPETSLHPGLHRRAV